MTPSLGAAAPRIQELFQLFAAAFTQIPLCTLVNDSVFVVHGGLSSKAGRQRPRSPVATSTTEPPVVKHF
eukprot:Skav201317  [mRNA]  locus=scaffold4158:44759:44968:+ [translate_table: standard]